jgi:hypothetical protein
MVWQLSQVVEKPNPTWLMTGVKKSFWWQE